MNGREGVIVNAPCVDTSAATFEGVEKDGNPPDEAIAICESCGQLADCKRRIGTVALALPKETTRAVIAGKEWQIRLPTPYELPRWETLPAGDGPGALAKIRKGILGEPFMGRPIASIVAALKGLEDICDIPDELKEGLGKYYQLSWNVFGIALHKYHTLSGERPATILTQTEVAAPIAQTFLEDTAQIYTRWNVRNPHLQAIRHSPTEIEELFAEASSELGITESQFRHLINQNTSYPKNAIINFRLRCELFAAQYAEDALVSETIIANYCATRTSADSITTAIDTFRETYKSLLEDVRYKDIDRSTLQIVACRFSKNPHAKLRAMLLARKRQKTTETSP